MEKKRENILVSACLLGVNCRYDGGNGLQEGLMGLMDKYSLIPVCPEQLGGMETPREPAEQISSDTGEYSKGRVVTCSGKDVTDSFFKGAEETLKLAALYGCKKAILKERSPSCGYGTVYDGTFSGTKIPGSGVTARLLAENEILVYGESKIENF
ncbi:DUF523 domain-containing protein [Lacrimispora sp.]|uniref:DUF523 domain-containing protein n=1 Tax=Lacrimispora sp. TaxID=2719234 RepID=UPI003460E4A8